MTLFLVFLLASPQDVDRLLSAGKAKEALEVLRKDLPRLNQVQGRLVLQSFLAHEAYAEFWTALSILRERFSCPSCYADLGWTAAVRVRDSERALEEVLRRIRSVHNPRLAQSLFDQYVRIFHTSWDETRPRAEAWASREGSKEAWRTLAVLARTLDSLRAVRYALLGGDTQSARELLLHITPSDTLLAILPPGLERDLVALRLGRMSFQDFLRKHGGRLPPEDWKFGMAYLPPDEAWSEALAKVGEDLGFPEALPHMVHAGTMSPSRLDTLCGARDLSPVLARSCGVAYLRMNRPDQALQMLRKVVMDRAGEDEALLWLWTLEYAMGNRKGVDLLLEALHNPGKVACADAVCTILSGSLLLRENPEEGRKRLEALVLSDAPEPLKMLARHVLEFGPPSPQVFRDLRQFLEALSLSSGS